LKFLNTKNKTKLFVHVRHIVSMAKIATKESFCYGRIFFLLEVGLIGFCLARKTGLC